MFDDIIFAKEPVLHYINELWQKVDVSFFYGTWDWMNLKLDETSIADKLEDLGLPVYYVEDASHHVYFKDPEALSTQMIEEIKTEREGYVNFVK